MLDASGAGLPGVLVGFEGAIETVRSGSEGVLDLPYPSSVSTLLCRDERFASVLAADVDLDADGTQLTFYVYEGGSVSTLCHINLADENESSGSGRRTPALSVPDTTAAVVLRDAHGNDVRRVQVVLGEQLTSVRL